MSHLPLFLILFILPSIIICPDRNYEYNNYFDCLKDSKKNDSITTAADCFNQKPGRKWKCCYFEYYEDNEGNVKKKGCMKVKKNDDDDLVDLQDFVSKLSPFAVFNCKSNYLLYSVIFTISLLILLL